MHFYKLEGHVHTPGYYVMLQGKQAYGVDTGYPALCCLNPLYPYGNNACQHPLTALLTAFPHVVITLVSLLLKQGYAKI
jgi:hypothetical protein